MHQPPLQLVVPDAGVLAGAVVVVAVVWCVIRFDIVITSADNQHQALGFLGHHGCAGSDICFLFHTLNLFVSIG